ncbi:MAG TPA: DUF4147 domain-containing protein [Phycisphaerales bacterium]|nr:DUF4147 domain-containing protein [Phycisphaerales bacterium]
MPRLTRQAEALRPAAERLVRAVVAACDPARLVREHWPGDFDTSGQVTLVTAGKAAPAMAVAACECLGIAPVAGVGVIPPRVPGTERLAELGIAALEADHPVPTGRNIEAAARVVRVVESMPRDGTLLLLLSGGASAMLTLPAEGLSLEALSKVTRALLRAGATIDELNTVRKHCERLKGGGLARLASPRTVRTLILSDVVGDRLDVIGSGPTAADPTTFADALGVLERRNALDASRAVTDRLRRGAAGELPETLKPGDPLLARVRNEIVGSNDDALDAAAGFLRARGFRLASVDRAVTGEAADVGRSLVCRLRAIPDAGRPACILIGGETTVTVGDATGVGGRNQELALAAAVELDGDPGLGVLAFATDGRDGPTDAAGAFVTGETVANARERNLDLALALREHDSHTALEALGCLIRTGPTGTNVNDIVVGYALRTGPGV